MRMRLAFLLAVLCLCLTEKTPSAELAKHVPTTEDLDTAYANRDGPQRKVYKSRIKPQWFSGGDKFWYQNNLADGAPEFVLVDAVRGMRRPAFDHARLAEMLRAAGVKNAQAERLPISKLRFSDDASAVWFQAGGKAWRCDLATYDVRLAQPEADEPADVLAAIPLDKLPKASLKTGAETKVTFINKIRGDVRIVWLGFDGERHTYGKIAPGESRTQHTYAGHVWLIVDAKGEAVTAFQAADQSRRAIITAQRIASPAPSGRGRRRGPPVSDSSTNSPDGRWRAYVENRNIFVGSANAKTNGEMQGYPRQLTTDGEAGHDYRRLQWSPDSRALIAFRVKPGDRHLVHLVESSPRDGGRAKLTSRPYELPGDEMTEYELSVFAVGEWKQTRPKVGAIDFGHPRLRWHEDGRRFRYEKIDRGHQRLRVIEVDAHTGDARNIIDEQTATFIWTAHSEIASRPVNWLEQTDEIVYASEVDGYRHLYLIDPNVKPKGEEGAASPEVESGSRKLFAPGLKHRITEGNFVVRGIDRIDEQKRKIWFRASGANDNQDPYFIHYYRVNFDGTDLVALTAGDGNHSVEYSPDGRFLIDTCSRVDMPPVHELRRTEDGSLVCKLEESELVEDPDSPWPKPEVFVAKGRDGKTDIWGVIYRPKSFDPAKTYPVIEAIYAGPHGSFVPKSFNAGNPYVGMNTAGFIVVKIDGMGTANRSKDFHDVCWHNLKDAGFPDRIAWMKAAAAKYPQFDLSRIGIYGGSAGGQNAAGALLFHPEFYKVAVAGCGCHDNRMDKASWNEQWMGYPVGPQYAKSSNIDNAHRLRGRLLLIVGELDNNVPPESTLRFADALIKARKEFELVVVPSGGHGMGGSYGRRKMMDFFIQHLHGISPRNWNSQGD